MNITQISNIVNEALYDEIMFDPLNDDLAVKAGQIIRQTLSACQAKKQIAEYDYSALVDVDENGEGPHLYLYLAIKETSGDEWESVRLKKF